MRTKLHRRPNNTLHTTQIWTALRLQSNMTVKRQSQWKSTYVLWVCRWTNWQWFVIFKKSYFSSQKIRFKLCANVFSWMACILVNWAAYFKSPVLSRDVCVNHTGENNSKNQKCFFPYFNLVWNKTKASSKVW